MIFADNMSNIDGIGIHISMGCMDSFELEGVDMVGNDLSGHFDYSSFGIDFGFDIGSGIDFDIGFGSNTDFAIWLGKSFDFGLGMDSGLG